MAHQNSSPNIYNGAPVATTHAAKSPMSYWWPLGMFLGSVLFFVIGGGLLGGWASTATCSYYDSYYSYGSTAYNCDGNRSMFYAGVAMIIIGAILKFVFWVLLIIWCVKRRHSRTANTVVYVNAQANAENGHGHVEKPQPYNNVYGAPQANYTGVPQQDFAAPTEYSGIQQAPVYGAAVAATGDKQTVTRYCGQCGTGTTTGYCTRCGTQVAMQ